MLVSQNMLGLSRSIAHDATLRNLCRHREPQMINQIRKIKKRTTAAPIKWYMYLRQHIFTLTSLDDFFIFLDAFTSASDFILVSSSSCPRFTVNSRSSTMTNFVSSRDSLSWPIFDRLFGLSFQCVMNWVIFSWYCRNVASAVDAWKG